MNNNLAIQPNNNGANILLRNFGGVSKPKTKESKTLSKQDQAGIVKLYEALVPKREMDNIDINTVRRFFPTFNDIDVDMIAQEAFPAFERTIGVQNFEKVKRYFGIGSKPKKVLGKPREIESLISNLRTMENAQYYLCGYKELVEKVAKKLEGAPEELTAIERAKIIRMYFMIFAGFFYFVEDFSYSNFSKTEVAIDYSKVQANNKREIYPEELFILYVSKAKSFKDESVFYDVIYHEISNLDKRTLKEVLNFAELEIVDGKFVSVNATNPVQTFGSVRNLKQRVHKEPGVFPMETFVEKEMADKLDLGDLFSIYKILKTFELEELKSEEKPFRKLEGSRMVETTHLCYQVVSDVFIAGPIEKDRFIRLMEYIAYRGLKMTLRHDSEGKPLENPVKYDVKIFMSAIKFANAAEYLSSLTTIERDFEVANMLIQMDKTGALAAYGNEELSVEELKARLGIDDEFEFTHFNIRRPVSHKNVVAKFAVENGYVASEEEIDFSLIENVFVPGNESIIERYNAGDISTERFGEKIGFNEEFAEMFFKLSKIDMSIIEETLLETKRSTSVGQKKIAHNLRLLVLLYCYLVEEQVPCGPKNRVPKRNKALKPSNLRNFID